MNLQFIVIHFGIACVIGAFTGIIWHSRKWLAIWSAVNLTFWLGREMWDHGWSLSMPLQGHFEWLVPSVTFAVAGLIANLVMSKWRV